MTSQSDRDGYAALEPRSVWGLFAGIAAVPRPSKQEERICKHVREVAERSGLTVHEDQTGNLVIDVPATAGHADAPITVLQAHLDMVCEKNAATRHDFDNEGIRLLLETETASPPAVRLAWPRIRAAMLLLLLGSSALPHIVYSFVI